MSRHAKAIAVLLLTLALAGVPAWTAALANDLAQGHPMPGTNTPLVGTDFLTMEAVQNAANYTPGPRAVPGRKIPVPSTISEPFRAQVSAPYRTPDWDAHPKTTRTGTR